MDTRYVEWEGLDYTLGFAAIVDTDGELRHIVDICEKCSGDAWGFEVDVDEFAQRLLELLRPKKGVRI